MDAMSVVGAIVAVIWAGFLVAIILRKKQEKKEGKMHIKNAGVAGVGYSPKRSTGKSKSTQDGTDMGSQPYVYDTVDDCDTGTKWSGLGGGSCESGLGTGSPDSGSSDGGSCGGD